ncbi:restriction endonuclease subunit S [Arenibacter sp. F20364]|uniref:restriction endonuclease subunit S n=1 Tax=Arenibacter sp. F20364 TaxID=2926415 RepID=UPI001FF23C64|nr:restriction endonuclease subunit S [Arenibacter sp. F20364]MCK0190456.1 restriction endonuclease subunit S [Arenibacter sp. F20364]
MINISKTTLGKLIEFQRGYDLPKSEMIDGVYPVRSSNGILGYHNEYKAKGPGITIGRSGTVGIPHLIKSNFYPHNTSLFIKDFKGNDVEYIFYLLTNLKLGDRKSGSGVPTMNRNHLHPLEILAHLDVLTQKKIAKVLSDLDAKIEVNNKINAELEAMAKLIYDYWFVQFDFPDQDGKPYKSSGGKMVYNKELKREIPEGWGLKKLSNCCKIIDCLHSKKSDYHFENENCYLLQLDNIKDDGLLDLSKKYYVSKEEYMRWTYRIEVQDNDLVITNAGRVAGLAQIPKNVVAGIGRNITAIRPTTILPTFLYYTFQGAEMNRQIKLNTDTGSFFKSLNVRGIKELLVIRPPKYLEQSFEEIAIKHRRKRELNSLQNQKLSELRDWLLPMLMNGQVTVGEAEEKLGMVAEENIKYRGL